VRDGAPDCEAAQGAVGPAARARQPDLPFTVVAELRFGAEVAGRGLRRSGVLERLIASAGVVPPIDAITDASVDLRTW
jgi:hypothetical protein